MGFDRRETTLAFHVEDQELQGLAALLASIAASMANLPGGAGQQTYVPSATAPPTPNYGAGGAVPPNLSAGGRPNPAALGGSSGPPGVLVASGPPSALGGPGAGFSISGAVTLQISGPVTINASGTLTVVGGGAAAPGTPAPTTPGQTAPGPTVSPQSPAAPNARRPGSRRQTAPSPMYNPFNPFGNLGAGGVGQAARLGLGLLSGHPTQFLGQGNDAFQAGAQFYVGQQIGNFAASALAPTFNEVRMENAGLNRITPEDIAANRWRGYTQLGGAALGGLVGGLASGGNPVAIGAGAAIGGTVVGQIGQYEADQLERNKAVRLTSEVVERAFGDRPHSLFNATPTVATRPRSRNLIEQFFDAFAFDDGAEEHRESDKQRGILLTESAEMLANTAPNALRNRATMQALQGLSDTLTVNYKPVVSGYLGGVLGNPVMAQQVTALNAGDTSILGRKMAGENAEFLAATGNLPGALSASTVAGGGGQQVTDTYARLVRRRAIEADVTTGIGLVRGEAELLRETQGSAAAARRLESPETSAFYKTLIDTQTASAREYEDRAARSTNEPDRIANIDEARKARARAASSERELRLLHYSAAELTYQQSQSILGSRGEQAQLKLGRAERTHLFDEAGMGRLFDAIRDNLKAELDASVTELRQMKAAGAPAEKLAPIYAKIAEVEDTLDKQILERFERKWHDMAIPAQSQMSVAGSQIQRIGGTGQLPGPQMAGAQAAQRQGAGALLSIAHGKYQAAVEQFGADSPQALAARAELEQARTTVAVLPFTQINERIAPFQQMAGAVGSALGGARQLTIGEGKGSLAALPATIGQIGAAESSVAIAREKLNEDRKAGAGPTIIAADQSAIVGAQVQRQQTALLATEVVMPAPYDIEMLKSRNKLQRLQQSFLEPGNMLDQYKTLYQGAEKRLGVIDAHENKIRTSGVPITDAMHARFERQREDAKMEMFQYRSQMENGWIDRLVSYSQGAPSFAARARPTMTQAAMELERGQSFEGFRQSREFGFVSKRGFEYERARGFTTAGKSNLDLFPGDLAQMALLGHRQGKAGEVFNLPGSGSAQGAPGAAGDPDVAAPEDGSASEDTQQQILQAALQQNVLLNQLLSVMAHQMAPSGMMGTGPTPQGGLSSTSYIQTMMTDRAPGDNQRPRR